jgi:hypothetical protein
MGSLRTLTLKKRKSGGEKTKKERKTKIKIEIKKIIEKEIKKQRKRTRDRKNRRDKQTRRNREENWPAYLLGESVRSRSAPGTTQVGIAAQVTRPSPANEEEDDFSWLDNSETSAAFSDAAASSRSSDGERSSRSSDGEDLSPLGAVAPSWYAPVRYVPMAERSPGKPRGRRNTDVWDYSEFERLSARPGPYVQPGDTLIYKRSSQFDPPIILRAEEEVGADGVTRLVWR